MSANLAIDTNVLLLADSSVGCYHIVRMAMQEPEEYYVFLDRDRKIDKEYQKQAEERQSDDPEEMIVLFATWLFERESKDVCRLRPHTEIIENFPPECQETAEPALFGISCGQSNFYLITSEHEDKDIIKRCYRSSEVSPILMELLAIKNLSLSILPSDQYDTLREANKWNICSYDQLTSFLECYRQDHGSVERAFIELKCPDDTLKPRMIDKIMEALCGMLNSLEGYGYILVGVKDGDKENLRIQGIPLEYDHTPRSTWDELKRIVTDRLQDFTPKMPDRFDFDVICDPHNHNRGVLTLRVRPNPKDRGYSYKGEEYIRVGERTQRLAK